MTTPTEPAVIAYVRAKLADFTSTWTPIGRIALHEWLAEYDEVLARAQAAEAAQQYWRDGYADATTEINELRAERDAARAALESEYNEGWNCGDWRDGQDNDAAREYDWRHSVACRALAAAQPTTEDTV